MVYGITRGEKQRTIESSPTRRRMVSVLREVFRGLRVLCMSFVVVELGVESNLDVVRCRKR